MKMTDTLSIELGLIENRPNYRYFFDNDEYIMALYEWRKRNNLENGDIVDVDLTYEEIMNLMKIIF